MPPAGFEPIIPASEWPQTHALDRTATGIGSYNDLVYYKLLTVFTAKSWVLLSKHHNLQEHGIYCENSSFESFRGFVMVVPLILFGVVC